MLLKTFHMRDFQSTTALNPVDVGEITCLVGNNGAGKTSLLKALHRLNPIEKPEDKFDVTDDYPYSCVTGYEQRIKAGKQRGAIVTEAMFTLEVEELKPIEEHFGAGVHIPALSARIQQAREEERVRIARELHDQLGSELISLKWDLEILAKTLPAAANESDLTAVRRKLETMVRRTGATFNTAKRIASELRPCILDDLGLMDAVDCQVQQFQARTGIRCQCECPLENIALDREESTAIFRIFQEALTNILRHAQATKTDIVMGEDAGEFVMTIRDNGRGISKDRRSDRLSFGLLGMRERAHLAGGTIDIASIEGRGTMISVRIPIPCQQRR
jgi:signal transduction histidine kinase